MKAIEFLNWIVGHSIEGKLLNIVVVPNEGEYSWEQNEEWWTQMFGNYPPCQVEEGGYLYYYKSQIDEYITDANGNIKEPEVTIELPTDSGFDYIYLYKLED